MRASGKQPTVLHMDIIELWAQGVSNKEIAARLKCSTETVIATKQNEVYKKMFYERQNAQIVELVPLAIKRLTEMLKDDRVQASVQIAAIKEVFDRAHLTELLDVGNKDVRITVTYE